MFRCGVSLPLVNGHPVNEIRAGLTFGFDVEGGATKPGVTFGNWGLSYCSALSKMSEAIRRRFGASRQSAGTPLYT
jgi:hypothetical protein